MTTRAIAKVKSDATVMHYTAMQRNDQPHPYRGQKVRIVAVLDSDEPLYDVVPLWAEERHEKGSDAYHNSMATVAGSDLE